MIDEREGKQLLIRDITNDLKRHKGYFNYILWRIKEVKSQYTNYLYGFEENMIDPYTDWKYTERKREYEDSLKYLRIEINEEQKYIKKRKQTIRELQREIARYDRNK